MTAKRDGATRQRRTRGSLWNCLISAGLLVVVATVAAIGLASAAAAGTTSSTATNSYDRAAPYVQSASTRVSRLVLGIELDARATTARQSGDPRPSDFLAVEDVATAVFRRGGEVSGSGGAQLAIDEARAAAERNGINTRSMNIQYGGPGGDGSIDWGSTSLTYAGPLLRAPTGQFEVTLYDVGLASEQDAVNTWGARTRSRGEFVFVDEAAEEIAPTHLRSVRRRDGC